MNPIPEQFRRLEQLFSEALELPPALRADLVSRVRVEEGAVMADQLEALLAAQSDETESMFEPLVTPVIRNPSTPSAFAEGDIILKRFRVIRLLGRGGMGEVYEVHDSEIGRVALKTIREDAWNNLSLLRFKQEVQLARLVTNPHVCRIHEFFTAPAEGPRPPIAFLTMEFLDGDTLADRIETQGPLPWREAESIALQLCEGLAAIHRAGVIHRDFKSRNIMLPVHNGVTRAVIMDLGLAHRPELDETLPRGRAPITIVGTVMGTPDYMAPEQFESARVSPATDIYAFGVVLYEMVTGKLPFEASTPIAAAVRRAKRPDAASAIQPGVPHRWDKVIEKCLRYDAADRFASAMEAGQALKGKQPVPWAMVWNRQAHAGGKVQHRFLSSRRAFLFLGGSATAAALLTTKFWPQLEMWRHPLPVRRFVTAMVWPIVSDPHNARFLKQLLATISSELARAEIYDKTFLILDGGPSRGDYAATTPTEAAGILGANLVLAASLLQSGKRLKVALTVLDPISSSPLREDTVSGSPATLAESVATSAARLLGVRLVADTSKAGDNLPQSQAYGLFLAAQDEMRLPNNEGLPTAIQKYQAAIASDPRFADAYAGLAIAFCRRFAFHRDPSDLSLAASNSTVALKFDPASSRAKLSDALTKLYSGNTLEALRILRALLKADPGNEDVLMYEARAFREMNRPDLEEQIYDNLLGQRPNYWPAYNDLGLIYRNRGNYNEAIRYFRQAIAIAPEASIPWTNLGAGYLLLGKANDAREALQHSIEKHPNEDALVNLGDLAYEDHDYRGALDYYQRAKEINPNWHMIWRNIGDCYTMLGQPVKTSESYRKAVELIATDVRSNPGSGGDWMTMAYYSAKIGDRSGAVAQISEAKKRGEASLSSQLLEAQTLVLLGEKENGIRLVLGLLHKGISKIEIDLAVDLRSVMRDPRIKAALHSSK